MSSRNNIYNLGFFLDYMRKKGNNPFEILDNEELRKSFFPFIVNRFFSFSHDKKTQFVTQLLNRYVFSFYYQPEINFGLMYLLLPKSDKFERLNYIKVAKEKTHKYAGEVYDTFRKVCNVDYLTNKDITEYISYLLEKSPQILVRMFLRAGYSKQEIKKWFPELKDYIKEVKEPKITKKALKDIVKMVQSTSQDTKHEGSVSNTKSRQSNTKLLEELL